MAEIKSSIQIAMERAAALGGASQAELAAEEGKRLGRPLGRRAAAGELEPQGLLEALDKLPPDKRPGAKAAAAEALLGEIEQGRLQGLPALIALSQGSPAEQAGQQLMAILSMEGSAEDKLNQELAQEMAAQIKALGLGGAAVRPNPAAHPNLKARMEQSLARLEQMRGQALAALRGVLAPA